MKNEKSTSNLNFNAQLLWKSNKPCRFMFYLSTSGHMDRYLKNCVSKSFVYVIKHANFHDGVRKSENIDNKFVNKRVRLSIHQTMCLSKTCWGEKIIATS